MAEIDYHKRHEAYIRTVAEALTAAGFPNDGGHAEANDPRDGFIDLDLERLGSIWPTDQEVAVCWQEERGWWLLTITDTTSNDGRFVYELGVPTLAAPATVVVAVAEKAGLPVEVAYDGHPDIDFSGHQYDDFDAFPDSGEDPVFEAALTRYAQA